MAYSLRSNNKVCDDPNRNDDDDEIQSERRTSLNSFETGDQNFQSQFSSFTKNIFDEIQRNFANLRNEMVKIIDERIIKNNGDSIIPQENVIDSIVNTNDESSVSTD